MDIVMWLLLLAGFVNGAVYLMEEVEMKQINKIETRKHIKSPPITVVV